jgi:glyoxylase-like metal-dependent hydrolase (beta-lactamase superfamily II)
MRAWSTAWNSAELDLNDGLVRVIQIRRTGKGCLSYLVGSQGRAAAIDASLAPEVYLDVASRSGWKITDVLDTHIHADHLSRSRQLAERCGADLRLPDQKRLAYPFAPIRDGEVIDLGGTELTAIHTPGHTLESTSYLIDGEALLTGDTLFVEGVGRPDLEATPEATRVRAGMLYGSLRRILDLPEATLILPGHTNHPVSFDRIAIGARLAEVKKCVQTLDLPAKDFVSWLLDRIPPAPPNHHQIVRLNEQGTWPEGDPNDLEAGANRCAVS